MISGILPVDKPPGWTSHDVVARVRRLAGQKQVGHCGTLDPLASGVLLLVLGDATRLSSFLMDTTKEYLAEIILGATTATDDAEAPLLERCDLSHIDAAAVQSCLGAFQGTLQQVPPAYAALRVRGEKMYELARKGVAITREPRTVVVHGIDILSWHRPRLALRIRCGAGTYIRALARDIGRSLGVGGYLHALRRSASGTFRTHDCCTIVELEEATTLPTRVLPSDRAVLHLPAVVLTERLARDARLGRPLGVGSYGAGTVRLYGPTGSFIGLGASGGGLVKPVKIFQGAA